MSQSSEDNPRTLRGEFSRIEPVSCPRRFLHGTDTLANRAFSGLVLTVLVLVSALSGCQDPSYEAALQRRMDRQRSVWDRYVASERKRPTNLHDLAETGKALNELYAQRLKMTLDLIEKRRAGEWGKWDDQASMRQEQLRKLLEGQPEKIPQVWRELTD